MINMTYTFVYANNENQNACLSGRRYKSIRLHTDYSLNVIILNIFLTGRQKHFYF